MELAEVGANGANQASTYENKELGVALNLPAHWYAARNPAAPPGSMVTQLFSPHPTLTVMLSVASLPPGKESPRQAAEGDIEALKGFFTEYQVRSDSWKDKKVAGLPAVSFVADYKEKDAGKIEYRTYITGSSKVYWFVFRTEPERLEKLKKKLDDLMAGFKVDQTAN